MIDDLPIAIRPAVNDDYGFILKTWTQEHHKTHPWNFIPNGIYFPHQTKIINSILNTATTIVACLDDTPDQIVGYLIYQPHDDKNIIIHYGCVKGIFRRTGVMKQILRSIGATDKNLVCTHYFELFKKLKNDYGLVFDPTLLENHYVE